MAVAGGNNPAQVKEPQPPGKTLPALDGVNNDPAARSQDKISYQVLDDLIYDTKPIFVKEFERIARRELKNLSELEKKPHFIEDFYINHKEHVKEVLKTGIEFLCGQIKKKTGLNFDESKLLEDFSSKFTDKTRDIKNADWHFDQLLKVFCSQIEAGYIKQKG